MGEHHEHRRTVPDELNLEIPDAELRPAQLSRRTFLRGLGLLGVAAVACRALPLGQGGASPSGSAASSSSLRWLAGDHHIHTQYSSDAFYQVKQQAQYAKDYGLDWLVITDHGRVAHEKVSIDRTLTDVQAAREALKGTLIFQGLEWNIPSAEHGTVFFAPGPNEADLLHFFEKSFDGVVLYGAKSTASDKEIEQKAAEALAWMSAQVKAGRSAAGLFLANHPARRGLDSPHEIRMWNDAAKDIAVGFEGAPGHQAAGLGYEDDGPASARGFYDFAPLADSHKAYPPEAYRTHGGFDWMTAKVGGLWDSLLAEGRRWWITANSDSHANWRDTWKRGDGIGQYDDDKSAFFGAYGDPVRTPSQQRGYGDYYPGFYSKTFVGATKADYPDVMEGIRSGRMWVVHGGLITSLDVAAAGQTFGGTAKVKKGDDLEITISFETGTKPNFIGDTPRLRRVDIISGPVVGSLGDADAMAAVETKVVRSFDISQAGSVKLTHKFTKVDRSFYFRLRGTDGNVSAPGSIEPRLDPQPVNAWKDLWFYANPIFVEVV